MASAPEPIELRRARDFSGQVNVTVEFIRQNYRQLGRALVRIAGVPLLLTVLVPALFWWLQYVVYTTHDANAVELFFAASKIIVPAQVLLHGVSLAFIIGVVNAYVMLYRDRGPEGFGGEDVWREFKGRFWRIIRIMLGLGLLASILPLFSLGGLITGEITSMVIGLAAGVFVLRFLVRWSLIFTVMFQEDGEFSDMMDRCKELVRDRWWLTFGVILLFFGLVIGLMMVMNIAPALIRLLGHIDPYWEGGAILSAAMIVLSACTTLVHSAGLALPILAVALHYFNLAERADGTGIMERIGTIGAETDVAEPGEDERNVRPEIA